MQRPFALFAAENIDQFKLLIDDLVEVEESNFPGWMYLDGMRLEEALCYSYLYRK